MSTTVTQKETLFAEERQAQILKLLREEHKVLVPVLCEKFNVSPVTIRNDLNSMQERGLLKRTHGGAVLKNKTGYEANVEEKLSKNYPQKEKIAEFAVNYVEDGDIIALDTGTTMLSFAKKLINKKNLTIITNDINIASYFDDKDDVTVIMLGGILRKRHSCTLGAMTLAGLDGLKVDKCFLATNGLSASFGLSTPDMNHADVKKKLADIGEQIIVLCDSEKIGHDVFVKVIDITKVDVIITDSGVDEIEVNKIEEKGVEIKIVSMEENNEK